MYSQNTRRNTARNAKKHLSLETKLGNGNLHISAASGDLFLARVSGKPVLHIES